METKFNGITTGINSTERKSAELGQSECNGGTNGDRGSVYYGVYISSENQNEDNAATINVFQDKVEALKLVKKNKKARFKAFNFYHEAADFAINGAEVQNNNNGQNAAETASAVGEKPSPYRGPKSQDLVMLRKVIESGNIETVTHMIWENPRYLISAGDTPSILQVKRVLFVVSVRLKFFYSISRRVFGTMPCMLLQKLKMMQCAESSCTPFLMLIL